MGIAGDGCKYYKECLKCPFPKCFYDLTKREALRFSKIERNARIVAEYSTGRPVPDIAKEFGLSYRQILRIISSRPTWVDENSPEKTES